MLFLTLIVYIRTLLMMAQELVIELINTIIADRILLKLNLTPKIMNKEKVTNCTFWFILSVGAPCYSTYGPSWPERNHHNLHSVLCESAVARGPITPFPIFLVSNNWHSRFPKNLTTTPKRQHTCNGGFTSGGLHIFGQWRLVITSRSMCLFTGLYHTNA